MAPLVAAPPQRRQIQPAADFFAGPLQVRPDDGVGRHAAGGDDGGAARLLCGFHDAGDQRIADSLGEVRASARGIQRLTHLLGVMGQIHHSRFQAGKAHIQRGTLHMGMGQGVDTAPGLLASLSMGAPPG